MDDFIGLTEVFLLESLALVQKSPNEFILFSPKLSSELLLRLEPAISSIGGVFDKEENCFKFDYDPSIRLKRLIKEWMK